MKKKDELFMLLIVSFIMACALDWPIVLRIAVIIESVLMLDVLIWTMFKK